MPNSERICLSWFKRLKEWATRRKGKKRVDIPAPSTTNDSEKSNCPLPQLPSKKEYAFEATKRTIEILKGVASLVGIPLVQEILEIGLSIVTTCEAASAVHDRVAELKNRIASFLLVIAKISKDPKKVHMLKASYGLMEELLDLKNCLSAISKRLDSIASQNLLLTTLLSAPNLKAIDDCVDYFQDGIKRFQILREIHASEDLTQVQDQLEGVLRKLDNIHDGLQEIRGDMKISFAELRAMLDKMGIKTNTFTTSADIPLVPEIFLGRDTIVKRIAEAVSSADLARSRVCILGPGGMGKTSIALAVMHHSALDDKFVPKNRIWVPCVSLTSPNALLAYLLSRLGIASQPDPLQAIVMALRQDATPYIVVFDNFETPWHPIKGEQVLTKNIIRTFDTLPNVSIIITMRSGFPPLPHWHAEHVDVLTLEDSRRVYNTIRGQTEKNKALDPLLGAVGRLPYAVTLVATQAKYANASPSQMLSEWIAVGCEMLINVEDTSKGMDSSIEMSVKSAYVTKSAGAMELLQVLSMLPGGIYQDDISIWMKPWRVTALSTLRNAALVVTHEVTIEGATRLHLLVLPVVQSYMQRHDRIPKNIRRSLHDSCINFLRARKSIIEGPNDPQYRIDLPEVAAQEINLQNILTEILQGFQGERSSSSFPSDEYSPTEQHLDAFVTFAFYHCWTRPRLDFAEQVLALAKRAKSPLHEAESTFCLAWQQSDLMLESQAIKEFENARNLYLSLGMTVKACYSDAFTIDDYDCDNDTLRTAQGPQAALERMQLRWKPYISQNPVVYGIITFWATNFAWVHNLTLEGSTVLENLLDVREIFIAQRRPFDLRFCLVTLARYLLWSGQPDEARVIVEEAFDLTAKEHLPVDSHFLFCYICKARCLKLAGEWGPELHAVLRQGLISAESSRLNYEIARLLDELGEAYVREKDWVAARTAYKGINKQSKHGPGRSLRDIYERAQNNLAYIAAKEADPNGTLTIHFQRPDAC